MVKSRLTQHIVSRLLLVVRDVNMDVFLGRGHTHKFKEVISGQFEYSRVNEEQGSSRMVLPDQE